MSSINPLAPTDLIFSSAHPSINDVLADLKRSKLSISNRIHSIITDNAFVQHVATKLHLPLIANERCGSWYIMPQEKGGSAYFKSTDGHFGQWSFSLRRLNLHLLEIIEQNDGCIIVDSTRRGKSMPDALSKTAPIWIVVLNRLLFPNQKSSHALMTPAHVVSASEHEQIAARLDGFVNDLQDLDLDIDSFRRQLSKPLRPYWLTPEVNPIEMAVSDDTHPVFLCTASGRSSSRMIDDNKYVQGAADDHESWALGLDAATFWQHQDILMKGSDDELPQLISNLLASRATNLQRSRLLIKPTRGLYICNNDGIEEHLHEVKTIIVCGQRIRPVVEKATIAAGVELIHLNCSKGKIGSRQLRTELCKIDKVRIGDKVLCSCPSGRDLAVGVALALLCRYFAADGSWLQESKTFASKTEIKQRLSWVMISMPDAAPSRATLQSINAFLMS